MSLYIEKDVELLKMSVSRTNCENIIYLESRVDIKTYVTETVSVTCVVVVTMVTQISFGPGTATISVTSGTSAQKILAGGVL